MNPTPSYSVAGLGLTVAALVFGIAVYAMALLSPRPIELSGKAISVLRWEDVR